MHTKMDKVDISKFKSIDYDLEQGIMNCWQICDDLEVVYRQICDGETSPTEDEIVNVLMGIQKLYHWKFDQLFLTFEKSLKKAREME